MHRIATSAQSAARFLVVALALLGLGVCASGCAPQQSALPAPPAPVVQPAPKSGVSILGPLTGKKGEALTGHDIRNTPPFSTAYRALLRRSKLRESWLTQFNGPGTQVRKVAIGGAEYLLVDGCKAQSCAANSISILYSEKEKSIYALLRQNSETLWLGEPPDEIKAAFAQMAK